MPLRSIAALLVVVLLAVSCRGGDGGETSEAVDEPTEATAPPTQYFAEWLIDAEAIGADGPGWPFLYREVVDDRNGRYLVQTPNHLATQVPDQVVFCAAIFRPDPYCAATDRAEGTPAVLSFPVQLLRSWGPFGLYDLASHRQVGLAAATEPEVWQVRTAVWADTPVECFTVIGETTAANQGFEVCFTDDDQHLVATVDLQGDFIYEIDLRVYERGVTDDDFVTGLEPFVEQKASLQDDLLSMYPEIPAPRPTPTPDPDADNTEG